MHEQLVPCEDLELELDLLEEELELDRLGLELDMLELEIERELLLKLDTEVPLHKLPFTVGAPAVPLA
jgi:hypothetical protein